MLQSVELSRLIKISLGIGGFGIFSIGSCAFYTEYKFRAHDFYKASIKTLREYPPGMKLLGPPIRSKNLNLFIRGSNTVRTTEAKLTIPVKGQSRQGTLYTWGSRQTVDDSWTMDKCELEVCEKRWTFYVNPGTDQDVERVAQHTLHSYPEELEQVLSANQRKHEHLLQEHQTP